MVSMGFLGIFGELSWILQTPSVYQEITNCIIWILFGFLWVSTVINLYYRYKGNLKVPWNIL